MRNYGRLILTATSPVQTWTEPLALGEVVKFLELPVRDPDDPETAMLEGFIAGAREQAEMLQGRDLVPKQYDLLLDYFPAAYDYSGGARGWYSDGGIYRPDVPLRTPLLSVDLVRYRDSDGNYTTMAEGTEYLVDLDRGLITTPYNSFWPAFTRWPTSAVLIRHTAGIRAGDVFWSDSGARIKIGMRQLISHWFTGRLPFEMGSGAAQEYPFTVTALLTSGAVPRVR